MEVFYPAGMKSQRTAGTQLPVDTTTVSVTPSAPGTWSVVVAVNLLTQQPDGKHAAKLTCAQVSMIEAAATAPSEAGAYVAAALPSPVTCPATLNAADLDYSETAELNGPIGQSVLGFVTAYLAGQGGLDRYIAPGASLAPVTPPPYAAAQVVELRTHEKFEPGQAARPPDSTSIRVLARAWGYDATGQITTLDYALTLSARAGRWEVSHLDPSPLVAGTPTAPAQPAPPAPHVSPGTGAGSSASPTPPRSGVGSR